MKRKITKSKFEAELANENGGSIACAKRQIEEEYPSAKPKFMYLYYGNNGEGHIGTWKQGFGIKFA